MKHVAGLISEMNLFSYERLLQKGSTKKTCKSNFPPKKISTNYAN